MEYKYTAEDQSTGKRVTSIAKADSISSLVSELRGEGLLPLTVNKINPANSQIKSLNAFFTRRRVTGKELAMFTRQLGVTLASGLLLTEALDAIGEDLENPFFQDTIQKIRTSIQSGSDLSSALMKFPKVFPVTYTAIIKSGEATGEMHKTIAGLAKYLEDTERLKEKVKSAVRYPLFVMGFAILVVTVMVLVLIPKFAGMFESVGAKLPLLTRIIINISNFSLHFAPFLIVGCVLAWIAFVYCLRFEKFRYAVDAIKLKIPILGKHVIHKALVSRFCRTFGFLIAGGVSVATSLEITSKVVDHRLMSQASNEIRERVVGGSSIAGEMRKQKIFPRLASKMVAVGERSGRLSEMFDRTAGYYEEELETTLQNLTTMLEPILIIFVGGIVLVVVLALYLPIFHLANAIR